MQLILFLVFGFIVGIIARAIMPGKQSMGLIMTTVLGCVGSFLGGTIGSLLSGGHLFDVRSSGIIGSILGALVVLALFGAVRRRSAPGRPVWRR